MFWVMRELCPSLLLTELTSSLGNIGVIATGLVIWL